jgi:hypothetical protein
LPARCRCFFASALTAQDVGKLLPQESEADRRPHTPRREAPDVEVISIADLTLYLEARGLRPSILEVQVVDERQGHREHERAEIPERFSVPSPMDVPAQQSKRKEENREEELRGRVVLVHIAQPLPLEVQPPHTDLRRVRRVSLYFFSVLLAVDVRH